VQEVVDANMCVCHVLVIVFQHNRVDTIRKVGHCVEPYDRDDAENRTGYMSVL